MDRGQLVSTFKETSILNLTKSREMFAAARDVIAGGVGSADRVLVRPHPIFIDRGSGSRLWDVDGNEYVDYLLGYGPLILGHGHPRIVDAVRDQAPRGTLYGAGHRLEVSVAELLTATIPSMEQVRFGQSGTEAVQSAIRLARAVTGRKLVIKFEGHYHGWADQVAVSYVPSAADAGPATEPARVPMSEGQPYATYADMLVLGWNDLRLAEQAFRDHGDDIAGILTEPVMCNCGVVEPAPGYLEGLRALCDRYGAVLIFDEVQTGFRVALDGAQAVHRVSPDLTCLGKAVSGGLPVSVLGGRRNVMQAITDRRVFQAGTYNSNPLCLAAIPIVIERMSQPGTYERMSELSHRLRRGLSELVAPLGGYVQGTNTLFGLGFGPGPVRNMRDGWRNDPERMLAFKQALWSVGVYTKPTPRDIWYLSTEHSQADIDLTLERAAEAAVIAAAMPGFEVE